MRRLRAHNAVMTVTARASSTRASNAILSSSPARRRCRRWSTTRVSRAIAARNASASTIQTLRSFDLTRDAPIGAVGDEQLPFGIEYRASIIMRDVNVGYYGQPGVVAIRRESGCAR